MLAGLKTRFPGLMLAAAKKSGAGTDQAMARSPFGFAPTHAGAGTDWLRAGRDKNAGAKQATEKALPPAAGTPEQAAQALDFAPATSQSGGSVPYRLPP